MPSGFLRPWDASLSFASDNTGWDSQVLSFDESYKRGRRSTSHSFGWRKEGGTLRQWRMVIVRSNGNIFHAWAYAAPIEQYDLYLPIAKAMLASWTLVGEEGQ